MRPTPSLAETVAGSRGYASSLALAPHELARMRFHIELQWRERLRACEPEHAEAVIARGIERYHELSELVDHRALWPKRARILPAEAVADLRRTSLARALEEAYGPFTISGEEGTGGEEVYWRIVRPGHPNDTGPMHADRWFWDLGHGGTPAGVERIKVWVAVVAESGLSGLRVVPGSHRREWRYHGEERDGMTKPQIDEDVDTLDLSLVPTGPGDAVVFDDRLLHGGGVGRGRLTRVSFEMTLFVRPDARQARDAERPQ